MSALLSRKCPDRQVMAGNRATLSFCAGAAIGDAGPTARLAGVRAPTLVVWGDSPS